MKSVQDEVMSCQSFVELVTNYLEDAMPGEARTRFEQHMHFCEGCVTYLNQTRATSAAVQLAAITETPVSAPMMDPLLSAFRAWKQARGLPR
jgi:hypothetical protein